MLELEDTYSREKLLRAFDKVNHEVLYTFKSLSLDDLFERPPGRWSPADTLRHLSKSVKPVARAMRVPKILLAAFFGVYRKPSRTYAQVRAAYLQALADGAQAGRFAPSYREIPASELAAERFRERILVEWRKSAKALVKALNKWADFQLDRYRLPHPFLGKLTVREMLLFTLFHNLYHVNRVRERLQKGPQEA